ncbi:hypothetical protein [Nocardia pseudobrasiliensis]|uniref:hypothetical protein n=1 Tax=Nocardia pseudobrasiliensis TaxID=45979 RepID=UPI000E0B99B7|nr:hypothetical protein [Nocardia pseudobrasiliensis]
MTAEGLAEFFETKAKAFIRITQEDQERDKAKEPAWLPDEVCGKYPKMTKKPYRNCLVREGYEEEFED